MSVARTTLLAFLVGGSLVSVGTGLMRRWPDNHTRVIFCDVGQGDGILVTYRYTQALVDAGPNDSIMGCLSRHMPPGDQNIEFVVATHPDLDHIGGFTAVFGRYTASHLFVLGLGKSTREFWRFRAQVQQMVSRGTQLYLATAGQQFGHRSGFHFTLISPREQLGTITLFTDINAETQLSAYFSEQRRQEKEINNRSIASFLDIGSTRFLLMADLESDAELALLNSQALTRADILKVGHHGSKSSTTDRLLRAIQPEYAVISVGKKNRYQHPHLEVLQRLRQHAVTTFRTDTDGEVRWLSDLDGGSWSTSHKRQ